MVEWIDPHSENGITTHATRLIEQAPHGTAARMRKCATIEENHYTRNLLLVVTWDWQEYIDGEWRTKKVAVNSSTLENAKEMAERYLNQ